MKGKHRNDQLERFFQHNPIEDPLYYKKYVKDHPDHKMAWYLLGREYAAQGKEAKAAYCFAQAGEIYEAFERQKIVVEEPLPSFSSGETAAKFQKSKSSSKKRRGKWIALFVMLLLMATPASINNSKERPTSQGTSEAITAESNESATGDAARHVAAGPKLYFAKGDWGKAMQQALEVSDGESVIIDAPKSVDGNWVEWNKSAQPIMAVEKGNEAGNTVKLTYYNSQICSCQAVNGASLIPIIENWMQNRERAIVLQSAVQAYFQKTSSFPERVEQLTKPYPDNLLPGVTPEMQVMFPSALEKAKSQSKSGGKNEAKDTGEDGGRTLNAQAGNALSSSSGSPSKADAEPLRESLRIIIDTDKHRLALVSGNYLIRSYPVGLGGEKTPQGEFSISEKVRNPNGKSNGEFGSRGMTLSDTLYAIHGTNQPASIGKDESHGCVRMRQADIEELYDMTPQQTKVTIGKGLLPDSVGADGKEGPGGGAGRGNPSQSFKLPLQTKDENPKKTYKWLG